MNLENLVFEPIAISNLKVYKSLIPTEYIPYLRSENLISMGCAEKGIPVAAMLALVTESSLTLLWVQVHGLFRRRGLGRFCMLKLAEFASELGLATVDADYALDQPQRNRATDFFSACGFSEEELVGYVMACPFDALMAGAVTNQTACNRSSIQSLFHLSQPALKHYESIQNQLPAHCRLANARGKLLPQHCLAYLENQKVMATVVFSKLGEDVYFEGFYYADGHLNKVSQLIFAALSDLRQSDQRYRHLTMAVVTQAEEALVDRLFEDLPYAKLPSFYRKWDYMESLDFSGAV